jgi:hypothetical protein
MYIYAVFKRDTRMNMIWTYCDMTAEIRNGEVGVNVHCWAAAC